MLISWLVMVVLVLGGAGGGSTSGSAPATASASEVSPPWRLDGLAVGDRADDVVERWGRPSGKERDEWQPGCETWSYGTSRNVGLCEGSVTFVQLKADADGADVDGRKVKLDKKSLEEALGAPAFVAEDGWGVTNGFDALKVFVDDSGNLVSLDLFEDCCGV